MPDKFRTITLTGHQPVQIRESLWPEIAMTGDDHQWLRIRMHADGRVLVYGGSVDRGGHTGIRAGELLWPEMPLVPAIHRVAAQISQAIDQPSIAAPTIAQLSAVDVDDVRARTACECRLCALAASRAVMAHS